MEVRRIRAISRKEIDRIEAEVERLLPTLTSQQPTPTGVSCSARSARAESTASC